MIEVKPILFAMKGATNFTINADHGLSALIRVICAFERSESIHKGAHRAPFTNTKRSGVFKAFQRTIYFNNQNIQLRNGALNQ